MRDIILNLSEQTLSKIGSCDYSNIVRGSNNYLRIVLKTDIQWNNMAKVVTVRTLGGIEYNAIYEPTGVLLPEEVTKNSGNYEPAGFTVTNANGYISAMGYSTACDWLFIASECLGNSSLPVGDYTYITENLNGYRVALLGGGWYDWADAGGFYWSLVNGVGYRSRNFGGRLVYIPTKDSSVYNAVIASWKEQMAV